MYVCNDCDIAHEIYSCPMCSLREKNEEMKENENLYKLKDAPKLICQKEILNETIGFIERSIIKKKPFEKLLKDVNSALKRVELQIKELEAKQ